MEANALLVNTAISLHALPTSHVGQQFKLDALIKTTGLRSHAHVDTLLSLHHLPSQPEPLVKTFRFHTHLPNPTRYSRLRHLNSPTQSCTLFKNSLITSA